MAGPGKIRITTPVRKILINKDLYGLNSSAAKIFLEIGRDAIAKNGRFAVSLAGGSTPRAFYSLLASDEYGSAIDWIRVSFFFGDERNVGEDSPESNYGMASESLLRPLEVDSAQIYRWRTELPSVDETAAHYESSLKEYFHPSKPRFDLILLGLGPDAHTASLFPHTPALHETRRLAVANWVGKLGDHRLTITFPLINNAANVMFLVSGSEKAKAVKSVLEGDSLPDEYPAQLVQPTDGSLYWLLDEAAASLLNRL
jgi:6-phosphogluconolactonase